MLSLKIAWRNLFRHRGKSLVIGSILFLGAFLMTLGNGVVSGMDVGLRKHIVEGFTGDVVLIATEQETDNVFMDFMGKAVAPIHRFDTLRPHLEKIPALGRMLPVGKNMAMALNEDGGNPGFGYVLGVDFEAWQQMFPESFEVRQGQWPQGKAQGLVIPEGGLEHLYDLMGVWFVPTGTTLDTSLLSDAAREAGKGLRTRDSVVFMGFNESNSTNDIRLALTGIGRFRALNTIWGHFMLMDIESYRQALGYFSGQDQTNTLSDEKKALLQAESGDLDALFEDESFFVSNAVKLQTSSPQASGIEPVSTDVDEKNSVTYNPERGTYNMVLSRLAQGQEQEKAVISINEELKRMGLPLRAVTWQSATGTIGSLTLIIKAALFIFVLFLFFVAIIIIVNTLSMAALERVSEIGMMRAVGARKGFITRMFLGETALLSIVFGGSGIVAGALAVLVMPLAKWSTDNDILQLFYGGDTFHPLLQGSDMVLAIIQLALVTFFAVFYPLHVAKSITPLDAISRD